jgi:Tol biopolymer transport system component
MDRKREAALVAVAEPPSQPVEAIQTKRDRWKWALAGLLALLLAGIGIAWFVNRRSVPPTEAILNHDVSLPPPKILPVTTFPGSANQPSFSSDGRWVAFRWNGEKQDNWDIYVKETDGTGFNRLTTDPAEDCCAAWSSDGRQIAFLRKIGDRAALYLTSPLGGGEQKLIELGWWYWSSLSWSPNGKDILFVDRKKTGEPWSIWSLALDTREKRQLVEPVTGSLGDFFPAYSPDGRYIAFARAFQIVISAIYMMRLPVGEPKMVTGFNNPLYLCWTQDSQEIIFSIHRGTGETGLWRVAINDGEPRQIPVRGQSIDSPSVGRNRLVYSSRTSSMDIWKLDLAGSGALNPPSKPLISWTSREDDPDISPKGEKIAFCSDRSGYSEIWVCANDGTKPLQLTDMRAKNTGSPRWSPDGKKIAFDSVKSGNTDIYVIDSDGGPVRRRTNDLTEEALPRWSNDGRWIYFGSNRSGTYQVWKMPSEGGKAIQITKEGGFAAYESADGQYVYYYPYYTQKKGVWRVPASGGPETLVFAEVDRWENWELTPRGIYFINSAANPARTIGFYDFATARVRSLNLGHKDRAFVLSGDGIAVSRDGKWLAYAGGISGSDIMLVENFR